MIGINIAYNIAKLPSPTSYTHYLTTTQSGEQLRLESICSPNRPNVIYGYSGVQGISSYRSILCMEMAMGSNTNHHSNHRPALRNRSLDRIHERNNTTLSGKSDFVNDKTTSNSHARHGRRKTNRLQPSNLYTNRRSNNRLSQTAKLTSTT